MEIFDEYFKLTSKDSMSWLDNAKILKISSDILYDILYKAYNTQKKLKRNEAEKKLLGKISGVYGQDQELIDEKNKLLSTIKTYYLLSGYALENLIKGLSIENNRSLSYDDILSLWKKHASHGHAISKIANDNFNDLSSIENDILTKLEDYILWKGKYPLPIKESEYKPLNFDSYDKQIIDHLFEKIESLLITRWKDNQKQNN